MKHMTSTTVKQQPLSIGVLLTNLGSPDAPTSTALRRYLAEFLWDPRVVAIPRLVWWLILQGIILRLRPRQSAKLYQTIWTSAGSPLKVITQQQANGLQQFFSRHFNTPIHIVHAMRYGSPSIAEGLQQLQRLNVQHILLLPLYPQYSAPTTGSTFDAVANVLKTWRWIPGLRWVNHYHDDTHYIAALVASIQHSWAVNGRHDKLIISFHGLPKQFVLDGDPYYQHCQETAGLIAAGLHLNDTDWCLAFQSRFGRTEWLQPYCDVVLQELATSGITSVDIVCPGFAADCLETLEEIKVRYRETFLHAGGKQFTYIPALNDSALHLQALANLILTHCQGWLTEDRLDIRFLI